VAGVGAQVFGGILGVEDALAELCAGEAVVMIGPAGTLLCEVEPGYRAVFEELKYGGVGCGDLAGFEHVVDFGGQLAERAELADALDGDAEDAADVGPGGVEVGFFELLAKGVDGVDTIGDGELFSLDVFGDAGFEGLLIVHGLEDAGESGNAGGERSAIAALSDDDAVAR
jgi:hypothetical protein